ncbi:LuxR C-terminal-related transcriptional regulator [Nocardia sp. SC052]|uniref:LuxR C-terminal-related transcriptional regulator n=1 Tax=Nocardia sichangensis TaxID=3385975 RepID=UPI0039A2A6E1
MSAKRRARAAGLPAATDDFVGRDPELDRIFGLLLSSARLITLIGPGGIGKTRLAAETVRRLQKLRRTPVYWARLARLDKGASAAEVEEEVIEAVVAGDFSPRSGWDALVDKLSATDYAGRDLGSVLVMDNCEHVLLSAGELIVELLEAVPGLTILATSREPVGWTDEHVVTVPSLSPSHALTLFRQRAELTGRPIVDMEEIAMAGIVCRHMNNNPLFIRLAAAKLLRQSLAVIVRELTGGETDTRMRWGHGPKVGADTRHRGIRDAIAWSYDLCTDQERLLLDRMSVFAAGYDACPADDAGSARDIGVDLEAIEVICADDPRHEDQPAGRDVTVELMANHVEGVLGRLVEQSLVTAHIRPSAVRYSLLESIRVFAWQRLRERSVADTNEPERLTLRHCRYYRDKVVEAQRSWLSPREGELLDWIRAAWDNIVRAVETSLASGESKLGLEISVSLALMPIARGSPREIRRWIERTLRATRAFIPLPTDLQCKAVAMIGWFCVMQGDAEGGERILAECSADSLQLTGVPADWRKAPELDFGLPAAAEFAWGVKLLMVHRDSRAVDVFARAREKFSSSGDLGSEAWSSDMEAWAACYVGSPEQALRITESHLSRVAVSGARWAKAWAEISRAIALAKHGSPTEALAVAHSALEHQFSVHDRWGESWAIHVRIFSLAQLIRTMLTTGTSDHADIRRLATETAQLAGGATTLRARLGVGIGDLGPLAGEIDRATDTARAVLGRDAFATALRQGSLLRPEQGEVQRLALGTLLTDRLPIDHPAREGSASRWHELSTAEQQVATLAAAGWTNTAIAARRGKSTKTIDAQIAAILRKLVISSREDIIELVPEDSMDQVRSEATKHQLRSGKKRYGPRSY